MPVVDVLLGQFGGRAQRLVRITYLVMLLEPSLQPLEDLHRLLDGRLVDVDLLKAPRQRTVFLKNPAVLLVSGRPDAAQVAGGEHRLDQVRRVHDAT